MDDDLFAQVDDIVWSLGGGEIEGLRSQVRRYGIKLWVGPAKPTRTHFEAQVLGRQHVDGTKGVALEIGFHAEERDEAKNQAALARLLAAEPTWRKRLGREATAGPFFGAEQWRRLSDAWLEPDLSGDDVAFEIASRLLDYVQALAPLLDPS